MDFAPGVAIGRRVLSDADLAGARVGLAEALAAELAKIHGIRPDGAAGLLTSGYNADPGASPADASLGFLRRRIDALPEPRPAMELVYAWLAAHAPPRGEVVLCHGDFRTGNFLVAPEGLVALLDWEFAHWGSPAEDLAWICMRDWRFGRVELPCGGFASRAAWYDAYARASGRAVDPTEVRWWEIASNASWAAGCVEQGERFLSGRESDFELVAIPRRAAEMEHEALRLIALGGEA
jgi:aminoglycoside phosphotransferase (APT) family kinase protein